MERPQGVLDRLLEVIGNTPDGVFAVDESHQIVLWNGGAQRILGYSSDEVLGRPCHEVIAGRDAEGNPVCQLGCADLLLARAGMLIPSRDTLTMTKDGKEVWVNVTNIPVPSEFGGLSTVLHIFREVTARKHMEQLVERLSVFMEQLAASQIAQPILFRDPPPPRDLLSSRERQVLRLLANGANAATIGAALTITPSTARKHIQNLLKKLKVHSSLEAVVYASKHQLLDLAS
ncbi:MAG: PAS domain S-box protein [Chloroflexi bacterium]|nr:PAS domain S-box protein [Chloroflexota bacterium]